MTLDPYNLERFVKAQAPVYETVRQELEAGRKTSHWVWFIFPQITGLGRSAMAERFAITSLEEAKAYLDHPLLGPRLRACVRLVNSVRGRSISQILGHPDDLKFGSSMTLFARAATDTAIFEEALNTFFGGSEDQATLERL